MQALIAKLQDIESIQEELKPSNDALDALLKDFEDEEAPLRQQLAKIDGKKTRLCQEWEKATEDLHRRLAEMGREAEFLALAAWQDDAEEFGGKQSVTVNGWKVSITVPKKEKLEVLDPAALVSFLSLKERLGLVKLTVRPTSDLQGWIKGEGDVPGVVLRSPASPYARVKQIQ
jgi:chromosome segregation ATPase